MKRTISKLVLAFIFFTMLFTESFALSDTNQEYDKFLINYIINAKESDFVWKDEINAKVLIIPGTEKWIIPITPKYSSKNISRNVVETRVVRDYKVSYLGETTQPAIRLSNDYIAENEDLHLNKEFIKSFEYTITGGGEFTIDDFKAHSSYSFNESYSEKESVRFTIPKGYLYDPLYMTIFISLEPYRG